MSTSPRPTQNPHQNQAGSNESGKQERAGGWQQGNRRPPWQQSWRPRATAYQTDAPSSESRDSNDEDARQSSRSYHASFQDESEESQKNQDNQDNQDDMSWFEPDHRTDAEEQGYFVDAPEVTCRHCKSVFPSKDKLHKHLRTHNCR